MSTNHRKCAELTPEPYAGKVPMPRTAPTSGKTWPVVRAAGHFRLPPIIVRRGNWAICRDGIYCLTENYFIAKTRFFELDWVRQVTPKYGVNKSDFVYIFKKALAMVASGEI